MKTRNSIRTECGSHSTRAQSTLELEGGLKRLARTDRLAGVNCSLVFLILEHGDGRCVQARVTRACGDCGVAIQLAVLAHAELQHDGTRFLGALGLLWVVLIR